MRFVVLGLFLLNVFGCVSLGHEVTQREIEPSVIMLRGDLGGGTGFEVIAPSGKTYTLTNHHVCELASNAVINDRRKIPLRIIEAASNTDLCLLEPVVGRPGLKVAKQGPEPDDKLDIFGFGKLLPLTHTQGRYVGIIKGILLNVIDPGYATDTILAGNSGSPVLNSNGEVVGVAFASSEDLENRTIFISLADIQEFLSVY